MSTIRDPDQLVEARFLRIPYVFNGRDFMGADCIGLALLWFREHGYHIEEDSDGQPITEHWSDAHPQRYLQALLRYGEYIDFRQIRPNDVVLILNQHQDTTHDARYVASIAVVIDRGHFLVTTREQGSRVGTFSTANLRYFAGAIRPHFDAQQRLIRPPTPTTAPTAHAATA